MRYIWINLFNISTKLAKVWVLLLLEYIWRYVDNAPSFKIIIFSCFKPGFILNTYSRLLYFLKVKLPMYFESTEFTRISSIEPLAGCKVKEPERPKTTKATTFPQNIQCNVPGIYCVTIRYLFCLLHTIKD